jgi:anti-anti-sigma regulatory factor
MLRISVLNGSQSARLKLEGKLAHEWVMEAQKAWAALVDMAGKKKVIVDLADISFVDGSGKELLSLVHQSGSELVGSGPMITALIEEVQRKFAHARSRLGTEIASLVFILLFLAMTAWQSTAEKSNAADVRSPDQPVMAKVNNR